MPISEMQTRVFFEALSGGVKLPSKSEMLEDIQRKREIMKERYVVSQRHTIQVSDLLKKTFLKRSNYKNLE